MGFRKPTQAEYDKMNGLDRTLCQQCGGLGQYVKNKKFHFCTCQYGQEAAAKNNQRLIRICEVPTRYQDASLDGEPRSGQVTAWNYLRDHFVPNAMKTEKENWAVLFGDLGTGKTHLATSVLNTLMASGVPCRYVRLSDLVAQVRATYSSDELDTEKVIHKYRAVSVLLIDELGMSKVTEHTNDILEMILRYRYNECKATLFTTNHTPPAMKNVFEDRINTILVSEPVWLEVSASGRGRMKVIPSSG